MDDEYERVSYGESDPSTDCDACTDQLSYVYSISDVYPVSHECAKYYRDTASYQHSSFHQYPKTHEYAYTDQNTDSHQSASTF